jgi:hypothetical protein
MAENAAWVRKLMGLPGIQPWGTRVACGEASQRVGANVIAKDCSNQIADKSGASDVRRTSGGGPRWCCSDVCDDRLAWLAESSRLGCDTWHQTCCLT